MKEINEMFLDKVNGGNEPPIYNKKQESIEYCSKCCKVTKHYQGVCTECPVEQNR